MSHFSGRARSITGLLAILLAGSLACGSGDSGPSTAPAASASTDGGTPGPEPFCATRPALQFCEDFDEGPLPGRFQATYGEGAFQIDSSSFTSAPSSLRIDAVPGAAIDARLESTFPWGKKIRGFFQLRIEERAPSDGDEPLRVAALRFASEGALYRLALATNGRGEWFAEEHAEGGGEPARTQRFPASAPFPHGVWTSVRLELDLHDDGATFSIKVGDGTVVDAAALTPPSDRRSPVFSVGLDGAPPAAPWAVRFDTITFSVD